MPLRAFGFRAQVAAMADAVFIDSTTRPKARRTYNVTSASAMEDLSTRFMGQPAVLPDPLGFGVPSTVAVPPPLHLPTATTMPCVGATFMKDFGHHGVLKVRLRNMMRRLLCIEWFILMEI